MRRTFAICPPNSYLRLAILTTIILFATIIHHGGGVAAQNNNSLYDFKPVPVMRNYRRVRKPIRRPRPNRRAVETVPALAVQFRVYKLQPNGSREDANPYSPFNAGDRLLLGVTANQRGYLTIIRQSAPGEDGEILFPNSALNNGHNDVPMKREFVIPSKCPADVNPCAYVVPASAGKEYFTIIFSRDAILGLPEEATTAGGLIKAQFIRDLGSSSGQRLKINRGNAASQDAVLVVNMNRRDNEEIVLTFPIIRTGRTLANK